MENEHNSNNSNNNHFFNNGNNLSSNTNSNSVDTSFMYSLNNIIQESNSYYQSSLIEAFQNLHDEVSQEEFLNDEDNSLYDNNNNLSSLSSKNENSSITNNNCNNPQETSTVNSNDICLDTSFINNINVDSFKRESKIDNKKDPIKSPKEDAQHKKLNEHKRIPSAPLKLINEFEEFKYSSQYINLEKAFLYANKLILIRNEGKFDIESEEGNEICRKFLHQIEALTISLGLKGNSREYRKNFSKAYIYLFDEDSLCYLTEILDSAQEAMPYLVVNGEKFTFSQEVLDFGNQLFSAFCSLIMLLTDTVNKIREEIFFDNIKELKSLIKKTLSDFDNKWTLYEEKYINELIEIEKRSRRYIFEGIELEKAMSQYETKANIRGKLLYNDKEYNEIRKKFVSLLSNLNKVANIEGKGRDDLGVDILFKAESVLLTVSDGKSKGMRNLATSIKQSLISMRDLFKKYEVNIEGIDPQLRNNPELADKLFDYETKWEKGKEYLLNKPKYSQLLFFSEMIEIVCEKYTHFSIYDLIDNSDPSIFVSLPCILLLKAIDGEDKGICEEYIPNINNTEEECGKLFALIKKIKENLVKKIKDDYVAYNLLEKLILFDNTKEQIDIEKEVGKYISREEIREFKNSLINLSVHLQRYKPSEWNTFFELAMNVK